MSPRGGEKEGKVEEEEVTAGEREEAARGRRTPCLPLPPLSPPSASSTFGGTTATRDFNYFLIRSRLSPASQGPPHIMPRSSLRMLNANLPTLFGLPSRPLPPPPPPWGPSLYSFLPFLLLGRP